MSAQHASRRLLRQMLLPLEWVIGLVILFEEWGWEPIQRGMQRLSRMPAVASLERRLAGLSPRWALAAFALPSLAMLPVNVFGVWLTGQGDALAGSVVIVAAKLVSTSLVARVFTLTRPALMSLEWFARLYASWQRWEAALLEPIRTSWIWQKGREIRKRLSALRAALGARVRP